MKYITLICVLLAIRTEAKPSSLGLSDTTIVGKLLETDSIFNNSNTDRLGVKNYYGVHHLKVAVIDVSDSNKISDTLILAYVYNKLTESAIYQRNFDLKAGNNYFFYIHPFKPCQSDFPKIQGSCINGTGFYPESNKLIKRYQSINRVIYVGNFKP